MIRRKTSIPINLLSVLIILISVFVGIVGKTNAWFTAEHQNGVQIIVQVGDLKLNLYQNSKDAANIVHTYEENSELADANKKYVSLSGEIVPDTQVALNLILANEDAGSASMYLRFKFELYARGVSSDTLISTRLVGSNANFEYKPLAEGDANSGYYYYKASTADKSANGLFAQNAAGVVLMTHFVVDYANLFDDSGNLLTINSESVYIKLTVNASLTDWLGGATW